MVWFQLQSNLNRHYVKLIYVGFQPQKDSISRLWSFNNLTDCAARFVFSDRGRGARAGSNSRWNTLLYKTVLIKYTSTYTI